MCGTKLEVAKRWKLVHPKHADLLLLSLAAFSFFMKMNSLKFIFPNKTNQLSGAKFLYK